MTQPNSGEIDSDSDGFWPQLFELPTAAFRSVFDGEDNGLSWLASKLHIGTLLGWNSGRNREFQPGHVCESVRVAGQTRSASSPPPPSFYLYNRPPFFRA